MSHLDIEIALNFLCVHFFETKLLFEPLIPVSAIFWAPFANHNKNIKCFTYVTNRTREISTAITIHKKHTAAKFVFIKINPANTLLGNSPHSEIFWSIFFRVRTKYFSPNAGKYESEKLRIRTIFT